MKDEKKKDPKKVKQGKANRRRGFNFERYVAGKLKEIFPEARRKLEYQSSVCNGIDLEETGNYDIQCKAYKKYPPLTKFFEIKGEGKPVLICKGDRLPVLVTMKLEDWLELIK